MAKTTVVVPCFNEEKRLCSGSFEAAVRQIGDLHILFVDDGSQDETRRVLESLAASLGDDRADLLVLDRNLGKAEAARQGITRALKASPFAVGYWDADLSTPLEDVQYFTEILQTHPETMAVIGSRVQLMGRHINRRKRRHYAGRVFATMASLTLGFPVYDTQCGAKLFRVTPEIRQVFETPFTSRWVFDVEILARLAGVYGKDMGDAGIVVEYPLYRWSDVAGSKVRPSDIPSMAADLLRIARSYRDTPAND